MSPIASMTKPCSSSSENRNSGIRAHLELDHPTLVALRRAIPPEIQTTSGTRLRDTGNRSFIRPIHGRPRRHATLLRFPLIYHLLDPAGRAFEVQLKRMWQVPTGKGRCATHFLEIRLRRDTDSELNGCSYAACKSKKYNHRNSWTSNYCRGSGSHDEIFAPAN